MNYLEKHLQIEGPHGEAYELARKLACLNFIGIANNWQSVDKTISRYFADFDNTDDLHQQEYIVDRLSLYLNGILQTLVDRGYLEKLNFEWGDLADPVKHSTSDSAFILVDPSSIVATQIEWMILDEQDMDSRRSLTRGVQAEKRNRATMASHEEKEAIVEFTQLFMKRINTLRRDIKSKFLNTYRAKCQEDRRNDDHIAMQFQPLPEPPR